MLLFDEKNGSKELYRHSPEMIEKYEFITMDNAAVTEKSLGDKEASYQAAKFVRRNGRSLRYRELERKTSQRVKLGLGVERRLLEETDYTNAPAYTFEEIEALEWIDMVRETADNCWDVPLNDLYRNKLVQENYYKHAQLARKLPLCVSKMKDRSFDTFVELVKEEM
ncbi:hypothetical protein KBC03_05770 [Patescibacteria group bacterium]|nr:hypothetical protein [Patescibacteria group bacterium]